MDSWAVPTEEVHRQKWMGQTCEDRGLWCLGSDNTGAQVTLQVIAMGTSGGPTPDSCHQLGSSDLCGSHGGQKPLILPGPWSLEACPPSQHHSSDP